MFHQCFLRKYGQPRITTQCRSCRHVNFRASTSALLGVAVAVRRRLYSYCSGDDLHITRLEVQASSPTVRRFARSRNSAHSSSLFARHTNCKSMPWSHSGCGLHVQQLAFCLLVSSIRARYFMEKFLGIFVDDHDFARSSPSFSLLFSPFPSS